MDIITTVSLEADEAQMQTLGRWVALGTMADQSLVLIRRTEPDEREADFKQYLVQFAIDSEQADYVNFPTEWQFDYNGKRWVLAEFGGSSDFFPELWRMFSQKIER